MTPEMWQKVGSLYRAAMELPAEERAAFLSGKCGADEELRREVESLLTAGDSAGSFLAAGAMKDAAKMLSNQKPSSFVGQVIDRYRIQSALGSGGMGDVYLAEDTRLKRQVAIKFLPAYLANDTSRLRRFEQEARAASALNHPNILTIYEIGEVETTSFIVSEFIDGETLRQRMGCSQMGVPEAVDVAIDVASALVAAHKVNIVHRDIKPENIMIRREDGLVKVLDFGLAKATEPVQVDGANPEAPTRALVNTAPGMVMGTVAYMSPEQARGHPVDQRTDIWSIGVVLYEMIAGKVPFSGAGVNEVISHILSRDQPAPLARFTNEAPAELERIVAKALRKDREQRYQTVKDFMLDLQSVKQQRESEARLELSKPDTMPAGQITPGSGPSETTVQSQQNATLTVETLKNTLKLHRGGVILVAAAAAVVIALLVTYLLAFRNSPDAAPVQIKSLAVLPLDNLSGDPGQDYFADGMTEELIASLSKIGNLRVTSRTSVMQYKGARKPLKEIARELNVDAVVEGSVLRSDDRVRITVQLVHGATDRHLWAESYQRDLRDILALQSEVGRAIANEIKITLTPREQSLFENVITVNPKALEQYLQGRDYFNQGRNKSGAEGQSFLKTSIEHFEQATRIQPDYALAYAGMARAHHWLASSGLPESFPHSKETAMKALQIDERLAEAHGALAYVLMTFDRDWAASEKEFKRALDLAPSYSEARHGYALFLSALGRHDQAVKEITLARELDPLTMPLARNMGWIYISAHQYDRAIEIFEQLRDREPNDQDIHSVLGRAYVFKGMYDKGIAELRKSAELGANESRNARLAWAYAVSGNRSEAVRILKARLMSASEGAVSKANIAAVYTALGNKDQAIAWLEKAERESSLQVILINVDPTFDSLHSDPRFRELIRRVGLNPA